MRFKHTLFFLLTISAGITAGIEAHQQIRQTVGERAQPARQKVGERKTTTNLVCILQPAQSAQPTQSTELSERQQVAEQAAQALVKKKPKKSKRKSKKSISKAQQKASNKADCNVIMLPAQTIATPQPAQTITLPVQQIQPQMKVESRPRASTFLLPNVPQRAERPTVITPTFVAPCVPRPLTVARQFPYAVTINQRSACYPYATLTPTTVTKKGDWIQLDDGSNWKVRHRDRRTVSQWKTGDAILIDSGKFFTWSTYSLVNFTRNQSIDVELIEPINNGTLCHWITEISPFEGYLRLQNGSIWRMSTRELLKWNVGDDVIIAISKNWFSNDYSYVLINPRAKNRLIAAFSLSD
jgi:hypothetical protein